MLIPMHELQVVGLLTAPLGTMMDLDATDVLTITGDGAQAQPPGDDGVQRTSQASSLIGAVMGFRSLAASLLRVLSTVVAVLAYLPLLQLSKSASALRSWD